MKPDGARQFFRDLVRGMHNRMHEMPADGFETPETYNHFPASEKAKQHYGNDVWQLFAGIEAAVARWEESGEDTAELRERYGGRFVKGVRIGERLAVYQGRDFTFIDMSGNETNDDGCRFTLKG